MIRRGVISSARPEGNAVERTHLIIVSGASASGKTYLAEQLRDALGYPLFAKDTFKEAMMDETPPESREQSAAIGRHAWPALFTAAELVMGHLAGLILEANFYAVFHTAKLQEFAGGADAVLIRCTADRATTEARIEARRGDPERHEGHFDQEGIDILVRQIESGTHVIELEDVPMIDVDTSEDGGMDLEALVRQIRSARA